MGGPGHKFAIRSGTTSDGSGLGRCIMKIAALALLCVLALTRFALADFHALLHHARTQNLEGVRALLAEGADPNPPHEGYSGYTPLMFAAGNGDPEMTRLLIEAGAETERRDHNGERALQWAARQSFLNPFRDNAECARLLLEAGSPADSAADRYGSSPLIDVTRYGSDPAMVRHLLAAGADPNRAGQSGETPLYGAAGTAGGEESVRLLLQAGADPNVRVDHLGQTPLHRAALYGATETIRLLAAAGAQIEARQDEGETALFAAAGRGLADSVDMLLSLGADVDARAASGLTPVLAAISGRYAAAGSHADAARRLAGRTADIERAFAAALWNGMPEVAALLFERGAGTDAVDHDGRSAFAAAAAVQPEPAWLDRLVEAGADIARHGGEAMLEAAARGRDDRVARLIALGVAVSRTPVGASAILAAAGAGRVSTVRLLLQRGARLDAVAGMEQAAREAMEAARAALEAVIARAEASRAYIDVSAERTELARLEAAHARIVEMLGL